MCFHKWGKLNTLRTHEKRKFRGKAVVKNVFVVFDVNLHIKKRDCFVKTHYLDDLKLSLCEIILLFVNGYRVI